MTTSSTNPTARSARHAGAVGPNALVPRLVHTLFGNWGKKLDFGCGPLAIHARQLIQAGHRVTAYDMVGLPVDLYDSRALHRQYDVVYASNVLNVQMGTESLVDTLAAMATRVRHPHGYFLCNYPRKPRYIDWLDNEQLAGRLGFFFTNVIRLPRQLTGSTACWLCQSPHIKE